MIRPSKPIACAMIEKDPSHLQEIYDIGRRDALNSLEELKNICEVFHMLVCDILIKNLGVIQMSFLKNQDASYY